MGNITNWYVEIIWRRSNVPNVNFAVFLRCQFDTVKLVCYKRNNSWLQENKQFLFECSTRYSSSERSERVTSSWTREEKFHISKQPGIILFLYKHLTDKKTTSSRFEKRVRCLLSMALNIYRLIDVSVADWQSQAHAKSYYNFSPVGIRFFSVV